MPRSTQIYSKSPSFKKIATSFVFIVVILLVVIVYFSFSKAKIILSVDNQAKTLNFNLNVLNDNVGNNLSGEISEQELSIIQKYDVQNFKTTNGTATGKIKIINNHTRSQTLIKTTRFLSATGKLFRLSKTISVPAGGELMADVYADQEGEKYNIGPSKFTIPGLSASLQKKISGISETSMSGGVVKIGVLTQVDLDNAQKEFTQNLNTRIYEKVGTEISQDEKLIIKNEIKEQINSNKIGEEISGFEITAKILVQTVKVNNDELLKNAKENYQNKLSDKVSVINWNLENFTQNIQSMDLKNKSAILDISLTASVQGAFDINKFDKTEIVGFDQKGVEYYFSQYPSIKNVEVHFSPFWVKSIPAVSDRIEIEVK